LLCDDDMSSIPARDERTQVLVVGAGPVGLLAALQLTQQGVKVRLVEQNPEPRALSFPVLLHARSLQLLMDAGVSAALFWRGRPVTRLAVYTDYERRAVLDFPELSGFGAGLLTLPQDILRQTLTHALADRGVSVEWSTRLITLDQDEGAVWGCLAREGLAPVAGARRADELSFRADFVIGADGYDSTVRDAAGLVMVDDGSLQSFAFFDATTQRSGTEAQLALTRDFGNSAYPLQGGQTRFSFQLGNALHAAPDASTLDDLLSLRMPWYASEILSCDWAGVAEFRRALVDHFGLGRVWLAGEAAHMTSPLGVHSLNVGLDEANELALLMASVIERGVRPDFGPQYDSRRRSQWRRLLAFDEQVQATGRSPEWVRHHLRQIGAALPASGRDMDELFTQLRLLPSAPPAPERAS
jgi:2-polyprenyl-6-methoxyphenol hydroxylase-like FAD-dependent oxidoreductase